MDQKFCGDNFIASEWLHNLELDVMTFSTNVENTKLIIKDALTGTALEWINRTLDRKNLNFPWMISDDQFIVLVAGTPTAHTEVTLNTAMEADGFEATLEKDTEGVILKFDSVRNMFLERFHTKPASLNAGSHFRDLKQHNGMSVSDYHEELLDLMRMWERGGNYTLPPGFFMDIFELGLLPTLRVEYQRAASKATTLEGLVSKLRGIERLLQSIEHIQQEGEESKSVHHILDSKVSSDPTLVQQFVDRWRGKSSCYCLFCLTEGDHSTFDCTYLDDYQRGVLKSNQHTTYSYSSLEDGSLLPGLREMVVGPASFPVLLDSGANISLVHLSIVKQLKWEMKDHDGFISTLGGPVPVMGRVKEMVEIDGRMVNLEALVIDKMGPKFLAIIGGKDNIVVDIIGERMGDSNDQKEMEEDGLKVDGPNRVSVGESTEEKGREIDNSRLSGGTSIEEARLMVDGPNRVSVGESIKENGEKFKTSNSSSQSKESIKKKWRRKGYKPYHPTKGEVNGEVNLTISSSYGTFNFNYNPSTENKVTTTTIPQRFHSYECFEDFQGGSVRTHPVSIDTSGARPISSPVQRFNPAELNQLKVLIDQLLAKGIIERTEMKEWSSRIRLVSKPDGESRFTLNLIPMNSQVPLNAYKPPNMGDLRWRINNANFFAKLDLTKAFFQVPLEEGSRDCTTFQTPFGTFRFKVLPQGYKNSTSEFQKRVDPALSGLDYVMAYVDDILIWGETLEELESRIESVLQRLSAWGFRLNLKKCQYGLQTVEFLGFTMDSSGITQTDDRLQTLRDLPYPTKTPEQLRSAMGILAHLKEFSGPKFNMFASHLYKLSNLSPKNYHFGDYEKRLFDVLKNSIVENIKLFHPNWDLPWLLRVDSCHTGVGAVLYNVDGEKKIPISFYSHSLAPSFKKKGISYIEAYGIKCAIEHFSPYLKGYSFTVETDHRSLEALNRGEFNNSKVQEWYHDLKDSFNFEIRYVKGARMEEVDGISRLFVGEVNFVGEGLPWEDIQRSDLELKQMIDYLKGDRSDFSKIKLNQLKLSTENMDIVNEVLIYRLEEDGFNRVVVPWIWRIHLIDEAHKISHIEPNKIYLSLKERYYWPRMRRDVYSFTAGCVPCSMGKPGGKGESRRKGAWDPERGIRIRLHGDFLELPRFGNSKYCLTMMDATSKKGAIHVSSNTTTQAAIDGINSWARDFGYPKSLVVDRGTAFTSKEFNTFCEKNGIELIFGIQYHSSDNGQVEKFNATVNGRLRAMMLDQQTQNWPSLITPLLIDYNNSIHSTTGLTPNQVMFGDTELWKDTDLSGDLNDQMGGIDKQREEMRAGVVKTLKGKAEKMEKKAWGEKVFKIGDIVVTRKILMGSKLDPRFDRRGRIIQVNSSPSFKSPLSYKIRLQNGKITTRHVKDLKLAQNGTFGGSSLVSSFGSFAPSPLNPSPIVDDEEMKDPSMSIEESKEGMVHEEKMEEGGFTLVRRRSSRIAEKELQKQQRK